MVHTSTLTFLELPMPLPLALPLPAPNLNLMGIICGGGGGGGGGIRRAHGRMGGPRGKPELRGLIGETTMGALGPSALGPRALGPTGKHRGSMPLGRDTPAAAGALGGGGGGGLWRSPVGPNIGFNGGRGSIRGGIPCGVNRPTNLGGGSCRTPAGGNLGPIRGPLFSGLIPGAALLLFPERNSLSVSLSSTDATFPSRDTAV